MKNWEMYSATECLRFNYKTGELEEISVEQAKQEILAEIEKKGYKITEIEWEVAHCDSKFTDIVKCGFNIEHQKESVENER